MFATHDDLATAELHLLESQRKIAAQTQIINELRRRHQSTALAERFLMRLEQELAQHRRERDAIVARIRSEIAEPVKAVGSGSFPVAQQYPE